MGAEGGVELGYERGEEGVEGFGAVELDWGLVVRKTWGGEWWEGGLDVLIPTPGRGLETLMYS